MAIWSPKRDPHEDPDEVAEPDRSEDSAGDELSQLTRRLAQLGQLLDQTKGQVVDYLVHRESQANAAGAGGGGNAALGEKIDALGEKLDQVDAKLQSLAGRDGGSQAEDNVGPALMQIRDGLNQQFAALAEGIHQLQQRLETGLQNLANLLSPEEPEETDASPVASGDWQRMLLGPELAALPGLDFQRQQLLGGLLQGDPAAGSLIGQLLVFRSAMTDKMPPLLKEIGEAYYRWQPKAQPGTTPMEESLVAWLQETMQDAGIPNTIELVHTGERFDSTRHNANTRGVEVTEVFGWIVLRDNGRVYTKASVAAK